MFSIAGPYHKTTLTQIITTTITLEVKQNTLGFILQVVITRQLLKQLRFGLQFLHTPKNSTIR